MRDKIYTETQKECLANKAICNAFERITNDLRGKRPLSVEYLLERIAHYYDVALEKDQLLCKLVAAEEEEPVAFKKGCLVENGIYKLANGYIIKLVKADEGTEYVWKGIILNIESSYECFHNYYKEGLAVCPEYKIVERVDD